MSFEFDRTPQQMSRTSDPAVLNPLPSNSLMRGNLSLQVEVTFALDANGILAVTAQDTVTGAKAGAEIKAKDGRLSSEEIDRMVQDAEKHRAQDEELADKV